MSNGAAAQASLLSTRGAGRAFDGARLDHLWASLTEDVREEIIIKARWERLPRAAVIRNWWPELWAEIALPT